jgi:hypothetical protein
MTARLTITQALHTALHHKKKAEALAGAIRAHRQLAADPRPDKKRKADRQLYAALWRIEGPDPVGEGQVVIGTVGPE